MKRKKSASPWDDLVADGKMLIPTHERPSLKEYWRFGGRATELGTEYGQGRVLEFAKDLGVSQGMVYACRKFRELWPTRADLDRVTRCGLLFSHIRELSHDCLMTKERKRLERYIEKEKPSVRALQEKVRKMTQGRRRPKKQSRRYKDLGDI